ncbi:TPA: phage head-tail connector protein [Clostridium botulinum]|uniref:phage head-tail connector protein n=1 Tax=Clostridium botulinum TaxID=1491 RepID=UPI0008FC594A|nr:phage head-tail connector protein [Clostridium botulinum]APC80870.1 phage gp6-like head-tail connector family protein [Clostridium botulinum]MCS4449372.1 phage head-tail connector protein [Clostridium botulinum]MCS4459182.1 phage head-tail connector protein [Clostridium botulinum]MCS4463317.1 phage head-tail connector protein [Clostridium botulinum]MCS4514013.1 phage head-tail connector protein [Clostridium botulinum]
MTQLEKLKKLLGISLDDDSKDFSLQFALEDVGQIVKDYCHMKEIPEALNTTVLKMAIDMYRNENLGEEENSLGSVSSITDGDTSVSYRSSIAEFKDSLIKDYKAQLNKYRKLVW